ncbi:MAG: ABC transporter permease subunit [Chloroflexi bacterium]|nr:ABC transporter permease subunit [Chloroflexota bacterium]
MRDTLIIAHLTYREAQRRKILWAALGLGLAFVLLYGIGFYFIYREISQYLTTGRDIALDSGFNFVVMAGLYVVSFLGVMLAVLTSVGSLAGEISSHTIQALAVKPLRRATLVLGKWLGLALMLAIYIALLVFGIVGSTWAISGYWLPRLFEGLGLMILQAWIMLTISILGGTRMSTIANGVVAFMLYGLAFIGGWIEQFGAMTYNETAVDIGILTSLLVPSEAMWKKAAAIMQPAIVVALPVSPFSMGLAPSSAMILYAVAYTMALLALAVYSFNHRDL